VHTGCVGCLYSFTVSPFSSKFVFADQTAGRRFKYAKRALGYVCAILLAWFTADVSLRYSAFRGTPLALSFVAVALITTFFDLFAGIASVVATVVIFYVRALVPSRSLHSTSGLVLRTAVMTAVGLLIAYLSHRQKVTTGRLREHADALTRAQQASHSVAWVIYPGDRRIRWARGGTDLFRRPFVDVPTLDALFALIDPNDRPAIKQQFLVPDAKAPLQVEFRVRMPDGQLRWMEARGAFSSADRAWRGVVLDIHARKTVEVALLRSEKLAASAGSPRPWPTRSTTRLKR
jgi:PAS domain-containing protein